MELVQNSYQVKTVGVELIDLVILLARGGGGDGTTIKTTEI
jgi:hypothetical protein